MEWNNDKSLQLIDEYERHPILWNTKHPHHFSRDKKSDAWQSIAYNLEVQDHEAKQKMNSLLGSFRREKAKGKKTVGIGKERHEVYKSKWFAFKPMSFLLDKDEPLDTIDTQRVHDNNEEQNNSDTVQHETLENYLELEDSNIGASEATYSQSSNQSEQFQSSIRRIRSKRKTNNTNEDPGSEETYKILKQSDATTAELQDEFSAYGQYIAKKLRRYNKRTQAEVQHAFSNILYEADVGNYDLYTPKQSV